MIWASPRLGPPLTTAPLAAVKEEHEPQAKEAEEPSSGLHHVQATQDERGETPLEVQAL
jgi:hypothetical protein